MAKKLSKNFYLNEDVILIARELLGKELCCLKNNILKSGIIVETEAYKGIVDRASHSYNNRRTKRTETMYMEGGVAYVYLCYGIHHLFNVVTNVENVPDAVLIRSIVPFEGLDINANGNGPGRVTKLLNITIDDDKTSLLGNKIWINEIPLKLEAKHILRGTRIGIDYAGEDALLPYRFYLSSEGLQKVKEYASKSTHRNKKQ